MHYFNSTNRYVFYLMDVMHHQGQFKAIAIERVDSAMQSKGHHIVVNRVK